jgi:ribosomal protein L12E/L44/L45/RPP1/RPP2
VVLARLAIQVDEEKITKIINDLAGKDLDAINEMIAK